MTSEIITTSFFIYKPQVWQEMPAELLFNIFSFLEPECLARCQRVCLSWKIMASDSKIYQQLAKQLLFFFQKGREMYFKENAKEKFIYLYRQARVIKADNLTHYQTIKFYQTNEEALKSKWDEMLPDRKSFRNPLVEGNSFNNCTSYPYSEKKELILGYLHAGAFKLETREVQRPFLLACHFGDKEIAETILTKEGGSHEDQNATLLSGFFMAVLGNQQEMYPFLDAKQIDYNQSFSFGMKFLDFITAQFENLNTECAFISQGIAFLTQKGAVSAFFSHT